MRFSLRTKLIALTTFVVTITMADVMYFFTIRELEDKSAGVNAQMARIARNIATMQLVENQSWNDYQNYIDQLLPLNEDIVYIAIYDDRNWLRAHALNPAWVELPDKSLTQREQAGIVRQLDNGLIAEESREDLRTQRVNIQAGDKVLGSVHVGFSLVEINNAQREGVQRNILTAIGFFVFFSAIAALLSRKLSRPIERLSAAMSAVSRGTEQTVPVEGNDEIAQLARTFNQMVEGLRERKIIERMGRKISTSFQLEQLAAVIRESLARAIEADSVYIYLRDRQNRGSYREIADGTTGRLVKLDEPACAYLHKDAAGFLVANAPAQVQQALARTRPAPQDLIVPMLVKNELLGFALFGRRNKSGKPSPLKSRFAETLVGQAAIALENALLSDELREQESIRRELEIARQVQQKLLPEAMPDISHFQFDGLCLPAQEVGGDYFDFFRISEDKLGVVIADVSGKGTSAAFYMAQVKGIVSSLAYIYNSPRKVLCEANSRLYSNVDRRVFATILYGVLDTQANTFTFVRAGHDSLLHLKRDGNCQVLTPNGIGVGLESGRAFARTLQEMQVKLAKSETLILYTDGITETMNSAREEYGEERLLRVLRSCRGRETKAVRKQILSDVKAFCDGVPQHDDLTLLIIQHV